MKRATCSLINCIYGVSSRPAHSTRGVILMKFLSQEKLYRREYLKRNREKANRWAKKTRERFRREWANFFQSIYGDPTCQLCGYPLTYIGSTQIDGIHWDHRNGGRATIKCTSRFIRSHACNSENQRLWLSCDFGMLCWKCNRILPTDLTARKQFIRNLIKYQEEL